MYFVGLINLKIHKYKYVIIDEIILFKIYQYNKFLIIIFYTVETKRNVDLGILIKRVLTQTEVKARFIVWRARIRRSLTILNFTKLPHQMGHQYQESRRKLCGFSFDHGFLHSLVVVQNGIERPGPSRKMDQIRSLAVCKGLYTHDKLSF